jgi:signal transduction histidine kinase
MLRYHEPSCVTTATIVERTGSTLFQEGKGSWRQRSRQSAVLQERQRLAHALNASITPQLLDILQTAQSLERICRRDPEEGEQRIRRLIQLSQSALREMRALVAELHSSAI